MLVDALRHEAAPEAVVDLQLQPLRERQVEVAARGVEDVVDDLPGDAVVRDVEEAGRLAGAAQFARQRADRLARDQRRALAPEPAPALRRP